MSMFAYIRKMIKELPSDMQGAVNMPVASHLFMTNYDSVSQKIFHNYSTT